MSYTKGLRVEERMSGAVEIVAAGSELVASCYPMPSDIDPCGIPTAASNARLFVAAGPMLEALEEMFTYTPRGPCQKPMVDPCRCWQCKADRARAAIALAKGEKP